MHYAMKTTHFSNNQLVLPLCLIPSNYINKHNTINSTVLFIAVSHDKTVKASTMSCNYRRWPNKFCKAYHCAMTINIESTKLLPKEILNNQISTEVTKKL